jgi:ubiquinone/menaquinone biosynthesis C-methylase UbiE
MRPQHEASPFAGVAATYDRFRAPYPPEVFDYIRSAFGLHEGACALDLGCGPGTIAIPLAVGIAEVVAADPDEAMLREGGRLAAERGRRNIRWVRARAEEISADLGRFRIVTMGQSFHWMDRDLVLERISQLVERNGGLALVNPGKRRPQESWEGVANQVVARYLGDRGRHPGMNAEPEHEPALRRSAHFFRFTAREFPSRIERDVASILGSVYSTSSAARRLFGDRVAEFELELSESLLRLNPSGVFKESLETEVVIAVKSAR